MYKRQDFGVVVGFPLLIGGKEHLRLPEACLLYTSCKRPLHPDSPPYPNVRSTGVDLEAAGDLGIKTIWALSLPGKTAPITAGEIILDTIGNCLSEQEVL